ncbi:MAG: hypothetical protein LBQ57_10455 [Spirochaetales bacterium]|nr:hypothetical protein [Spirochaetales bacterium]
MRIKTNGEDKNFVGIGKVMIDTSSMPWNIPHLHFLVDGDSDHFEATCLEFGLVASGPTQEESAERLGGLILFHIQAVMHEGGGYEEFKDMALNSFMNAYWDAYRYIEFCLAEKRKDLSHEIEGRITRAIQNMFDKKVKELIAAKAEEAIREYEKMAAVKVSGVTYVSLKDAA